MSAKAARENVATLVIELASHYEAQTRLSQIDELSQRNKRQASEIHKLALQNRWLATLFIGGFAVLGITVFFMMRLRRTHRKLQRFQSHQQSILDAIPDLMFELGLDGRYYDCHTLQSGLLTTPAADLFGKTVFDIMPHAAAEVCLSALHEAHEKGMSTSKVLELPLPQGSCWFELSVARKAIVLGEEPHFIMLSRDITERKRFEKTLYEREREYRTLAENSPEMIARYDHNFNPVYINPAYELHSGINLEGTWSKTSTEIWKPLLPREEYIALLKCVMETGQSEYILLEWLGQDGGVVSHRMHAVAEYDEQKNVVGVLAISHNITALKETEQQLVASQHLLRQLATRSETVLEDVRKSLARELHNELGQYLMALRMNMNAVSLAFCENNPALQEEVSQLIALLDTTTQVVRNLVVSLRPSVLDMGIVPALEWLVDEYQKRTEIHCELHILDEEIYLDDKRATAVFRIVQELLTNIDRHAKASKVDIVLGQKENQYELEVHDNGKGFDPAVGKDKSFGFLGMRERVITLGGGLEISSESGYGTVIKVSIPVNDVWSEEK